MQTTTPTRLKKQHQYHESFEVFAARFADDSLDCIITDPPYGVLTGHKIEKVIDKPLFMSLAYQKLKAGGFFAFFGQEPTIDDWKAAAKAAGFKYSDKIIWSKRIITSPYLRLQRTYEEIVIYYKPREDGKQQNYYETLERYEDLKEGALYCGLYELSTVKTTISDLQRRLIDPEYNALYYSGLPTSNGAMTGHTNDGWHQKKLDNKKRGKNCNKDLEKIAPNNDAQHAKTHNAERINKDFIKQGGLMKRTNIKDPELKAHDLVVNNDFTGERYPNSKGFRYRSKWYCNLTNGWAFPPELGTLEYHLLKNGTTPEIIQTTLAALLTDILNGLPEERELESYIWSYLPENQTKMGANGINIKHPTVKPRRLMKRLIQLLCPTAEQKPIIADFCAGSGSLLVGAAELGIEAYGCDIDVGYCAIANERIKLIHAGSDGSGIDFSQEEKVNQKPKFTQQTLF